MRNWLSVLITDAKSKKESDIPIAPSLYSLSNEMDKSLLAVRDINHKYIVVDGIAHKAEYVQMFQDCGWEYITDMAGYSYFRKPVNQMVGKEEIFCDDASRMDMIERVFKGRMIPLLVIFFAVIIPQFFIQISIDSLCNKAIAGMFAVLFILYLVLFVQFGTQYLQLKKRLEK